MSNLSGKTILFLGSSVTYGYSSGGVSFAELISERNNCTCLKEAVSGTTLVDNDSSSYVSRLKAFDGTDKVDLFVCQLSTNDAYRELPLGIVSESFDIDSFDTQTVAGAIEYIIAYVREKFACPVVFYTSPRYESRMYPEMVELLYLIKEKWNISIIDMWNDDKFNDISDEMRMKYMADMIHPTFTGYDEWWTPYIEEKLNEVM